jgi:hypothetical protein
MYNDRKDNTLIISAWILSKQSENRAIYKEGNKIRMLIIFREMKPMFIIKSLKQK